MRIDSGLPAAGGRTSKSHSDHITARPAPAHVDTLHWKLADANERHALMQGDPHRSHPANRDAGTSSGDSATVGGTVLGTGRGLNDAGSILARRGAHLQAQGHS